MDDHYKVPSRHASPQHSFKKPAPQIRNSLTLSRQINQNSRVSLMVHKQQSGVSGQFIVAPPPKYNYDFPSNQASTMNLRSQRSSITNSCMPEIKQSRNHKLMTMSKPF